MSDRDITLKYFRPDDYHEVVGERVEVEKVQEPDSAVSPEPGLFNVGDRVTTYEGYRSKITGFAVEGGKSTWFARVNGKLYHLFALRKR